MNRREFIAALGGMTALGGTLVVLCAPARGQVSGRIPRVGLVSPAASKSTLLFDAFRARPVRVWKKRLEHQAHARCDIRGGCGLPVMTGASW